MAYDFVVIGSGMFGATFARAAADKGKKVLVVEKRDHIGGNCHTEEVDGVQVHSYGPHVFHTDDRELWEWMERFTLFRPMICRNVAMAGGRLWPLPMNLMLFHMLWGVKTPEEARREVELRRSKNEDETTLKGWALGNLGIEIYKTFIEGYTRKQWGRDPERLPASIIKRLPVRFTHDQNYFRDRYQGVPEGGYFQMFQRMLIDPNIEIVTHLDYLGPENRRDLDKRGQVIYSGRVDEFFDYQLGPLEFRSARFEHRTFEGDYQGHFAVYHCDEEVPHTRVIEHKHFTNPDAVKSVVTWEFPFECGKNDVPLYPIADEKNLKLYEEYRKLPTRAIFGGRLGHYRYMDMHQAAAEARKLVEKLC